MSYRYCKTRGPVIQAYGRNFFGPSRVHGRQGRHLIPCARQRQNVRDVTVFSHNVAELRTATSSPLGLDVAALQIDADTLEGITSIQNVADTTVWRLMRGGTAIALHEVGGF